MNKKSECVSDRPTVSVVMNCYNSSEYLHEAIDSVYSQTYKDWEIIFWDNASTDNSAEIAKGYGEKLRYFRGNKTVPLGKARNLAIENVKGKYIAILDCDDIWLPEKLEKQVALIEKFNKDNINVGLCYTDSMRIDSNGDDIMPYRNKVFSGNVYKELINDCFIACASCVIVKDVLGAKSVINEKYSQVEEWELWLRIAKDYRIACVEEKLAKIRTHSANQSGNIQVSLDESIALISEIRSEDRRILSARNNKLKELNIRKEIFKLLYSKETISIERKFIVFLKILQFFSFNPLVGLEFFRKYFNIKTYRLYKEKYINLKSL